ncbi:MAG: DUF4430 domain-containing protein [Clostridium sp.]|nr:DUF4430 domain-containing protein [Clostridium sp.]
MKNRSDQKRIIAGGILTAVCILLCAAGIWGTVQGRRSGRMDAGAVPADGARRDSSSWKETENEEGITSDSVTRAMDGILFWQCAVYGVPDVQELLDTAYAERAINGTVQTYVLGLYGYQQGYDYAGYAVCVQNTLKEEEVSAMSLQKSAMVLSALQADQPISMNVLEETIGEQGIMSYLYGLLMLDGMAAEEAEWTRDALVQEILSRQLSDGGFAIAGEEGDVDVTAMALQALAPYYLAARTGAESDVRIVQAVEDALIFLSARQLSGGDFASSKTPNAESTAQVILALCALERDVWTDTAFIKEGVTLLDGLFMYQNEDGGFSHTAQAASNDMASSQAFAALSALNRSMWGECFLFDFNRYERDSSVGEQNLTKRDGDTAGGQAQMPQSIPDQENTAGGLTQGASDRVRIPDHGMDMRTAFIVLIMAAGCGYLAYLCFIGKYNRRRLYGILFVSAALMAAVCFIRLQSRDEYLRQSTGADTEKNMIVSMEIRCDTVAGAEEYLPQDGVILSRTSVPAGEGESAFDVLCETARAYDIPVEYEGTAAGGEFAYIEGIAYLYEYDFGELSGWIFLVNGETPNVGCGAYQVADGDEILWYYTRELGRDVKLDLH